MTYIKQSDHVPPDHLRAILTDANTVTISKGRLEGLEAIEREVRALYTAIEPTLCYDGMKNTLVDGRVLLSLLRLVGDVSQVDKEDQA